MIKSFLFIGAGSALGGIIRYSISLITTHVVSKHHFIATLASNVMASILIGVLYGLIETKASLSKEMQWLLITGLCGGLSTFSTFSAENMKFLQTQQYGLAFLNIFLSLTMCIGACIFANWMIKNYV